MSKMGSIKPNDEKTEDEIYQGRRKVLRTATELLTAQRAGLPIATIRKAVGSSNKQRNTLLSAKKLSEETERLDHERVSLSIGRVIQQARQAKDLTQKDLAFRINEKVHVVADHENGKAVKNHEILGKMERVLGVKLRGPHLGEPVAAPSSSHRK